MIDLRQLRAELVKKHGDDVIIGMSETSEFVPTGSIMLDWALAIGGYPVGRITEIYGRWQTGKTTLGLIACNQAINSGAGAAYLDFEHAFDVNYARRLGLSLDNPAFIFTQPSTLEEGFSILETIIKSGQVRIAVVDSIAAMISKAELDGDVNDTAPIAFTARAMSKAVRRLIPVLSGSNTALIYINQSREEIGGTRSWGPPRTTTPGGTVLKFLSSVRIELSIRELLQSTNTDIAGEKVKRPYATKIRARVVKNKVGPPYREAEFIIVLGYGIIPQLDALEIAIKKGIASKNGSVITIPEPFLPELTRFRGTTDFLSKVTGPLAKSFTAAVSRVVLGEEAQGSDIEEIEGEE